MPPRNILFILADCLRADMVFGEEVRPPTPAIDELRRRGTSFSQAISSTSMTSQSVSTFFTGCYPPVTGVRALRGDVLNQTCPTLAELLRAHGYHTAAFTTGPLWEGIGLERGFERFEYSRPSPGLIVKRQEQIKDLMSAPGDDRPWFIYAHFYDIHTPRVIAPEMNTSRFGASLYQRAVATFDSRLAEILAHVNWDDTLVVFHADHGEIYPTTPLFDLWEDIWQKYIFGKKPWLMRLGIKKDPTVRAWTKWRHATGTGHGFNICEGLVRVPLILAGTEVFSGGRVISDQVRQVDIMPTILEFAGIRPPSPISGRSLSPLLDGTDSQLRPAYMEAHSFGRDPTYFIRGIRTPNWKYIDSPTDKRVRPQLYHLMSDPREKRNVIRGHPEVVADLRKMLEGETSRGDQAHATEDWNAEEANVVETRLRNLGYF